MMWGSRHGLTFCSEARACEYPPSVTRGPFSPRRDSGSRAGPLVNPQPAMGHRPTGLPAGHGPGKDGGPRRSEAHLHQHLRSSLHQRLPPRSSQTVAPSLWIDGVGNSAGRKGCPPTGMRTIEGWAQAGGGRTNVSTDSSGARQPTLRAAVRRDQVPKPGVAGSIPAGGAESFAGVLRGEERSEAPAGSLETDSPASSTTLRNAIQRSDKLEHSSVPIIR
jgi:hypothetical protein